MNEKLNAGWDFDSGPFLVGDFEVDAATNSVSKDGQSSRLEPRAMALLLYLARQPGVVVSREELEREVWQGMVVGYDALNNTIAKLRKAFGDDRRNPTYIQTVPKTGYRLVAQVSVSPPPAVIHSRPSQSAESHPSLERKLAAILYADVVDYSRLTGMDEEGTHRTLRTCLDLVTDSVHRYGGRVVHFAGDAILAEFPTASTALNCALVAQQQLATHNEGVTAERKLQFRIGVNLGEIIVDRNDIYGEGVNVAARLEALAEPGCVCLSGTVFDAIGHTLPLDYTFLGERKVKNIDKPVRAYQARVKPGAILPAPRHKDADRLRQFNRARKPSLVAMGLAALALVIAAAVLLWIQPGREDATEEIAAVPPIPEGKPSVAVLPFENMSDDPAQEFYADGMTGDLINDLSRLSGLSVIARHSVFAYKNKPTTVDQIATELGVRYLLEGDVRRFGDKIRINVNLIDGTNAQNVWSERYDGEESQVFELHNRVIENIVAALAVQLTEQEQSLIARPPTENLEAYDYYLRAERRRLSKQAGELWRMDALKAIELYRKAIELDEDFAQPYVGLALLALDVWDSDSSNIIPGATAKKLAYDSASKVRELDPGNPAVYSVLALLQATDGQHEVALESSRQAVELGPNDAHAWAVRSKILTLTGQHETALAAITRAMSLDPKREEFHGYLGEAQYFAGSYAAAASSLSKIEPWFWYIRLMTYGQLGRVEQAESLLNRIREETPFVSLNWYRTRYAHYKREQDMELMIEGLRKAGVPENAFGFEGRESDRLDSEALQQLVDGRAWRGVDNYGMDFIQQISEDGRIAFRNDTTMMVGSAWVENGMFCVKFRSNVMGRNDCGYVYRNPDGNREQQNEYVRVALGSIYYFSADQ